MPGSVSKKAEHLPSPLLFPVGAGGRTLLCVARWIPGKPGGQSERGRVRICSCKGSKQNICPEKKCLRSWGGYLGQKKSREVDCRVFRERSAIQASIYLRFFQQPLGAYPGCTGVSPSLLGSLEVSSSPQTTYNDPGNENEERSPNLFAIMHYSPPPPFLEQ